ncbi:MAG: S8 family peptidase [Coprococcus sp.]|nr:S8 family peptidase [Coprococcus sp.]
MNENCYEAVYSEDYADYIVEYNGDRQILEEIYSNACLFFIDNRYAILYSKKRSDYMESFGNLAYNIFPKLLAPMDVAEGEAAYNTPSILSMINGENLDNESVLGLDGKDIVIGIVDTGIDILNEEFLNEYGRTRIKYAWDQSVNSSSGDGYAGEFPFGTYYTEEQLNRFVEEGKSVLRGEDNHGNYLASIAAGRNNGIAENSDLVVVKLKKAKENLKELYGVRQGEAYSEADIMLAIAYILQCSYRLRKTVSILIGFGTNSGSHTGSAALEAYINNIGILRGVCVSVAGGNEGAAGHHTEGDIEDNEQAVIEINVPEKTAFTLEIWGKAPGVYAIGMDIAGGEIIDRIPPRFDRSQIIKPIFGGGTIYVDYFLVEGQSGDELILVRFFDTPRGLYRITLTAAGAAGKSYRAWLPVSQFAPEGLVFTNPVTWGTVTVPGTAKTPIVAAAYNYSDGSIYVNGSRGYTADSVVKPDLAAPGVGITGAGPYGTTVTGSGSSISAACAVGAAALMQQWSRDRGLSPYINGNQIRQYLIRGADRENSHRYPDRYYGFGILNLRKTFESLRNL